MNAAMIAFVVFVWSIGAVCGLALEGAAFAANETTVLNQLMSWQQIQDASLTPAQFYFVVLPQFGTGLFRLLTLDFGCFYGPWELVRWICWAPIVAMVVYGIIVTFFTRQT